MSVHSRFTAHSRPVHPLQRNSRWSPPVKRMRKCATDVQDPLWSLGKHCTGSLTGLYQLQYLRSARDLHGYDEAFTGFTICFICIYMLSATLRFAQTHHCDITETILCCWEVANPSKAKGEIRPRWHVKDTLNTGIFMRKQYHHHEGSKYATPYNQYAERANNTPPSMANMLNRVITST